MAESYISELGDKLSHGVANTDGSRVKIIAPKLYTDGNSHPSIATALAGKANDSDVVHKTGTETVSGAKTFNSTDSVFKGKCARDINGNTLSSSYGTFTTELGNPSLEERGIIEETFANQLECIAKDKVVYETSPKGTDTWTTMTVSDSTHNLLWGGNVTGSLSISKNVDFRITINAPSYCYLNFLYFYASGNGATFHIKLERKLNSSGAWSTVSDTAVASLGWPGHNTIRHSNLAFHPTSSSQYGSIRLTLYIVDTGNIESYPTYNINKFRYYGGYPYKSDPWIVKNGSTGVTSFPNGITSGVAIPISSGGTGQTTDVAAQYALLNGKCSELTAALNDDNRFMFASTSPSTSAGVFIGFRKTSAIWTYISGKISSVLGLTSSNYGGNAATATSATKATQDSDGNAINATYFKSSGNVTLVSGTATKIGTQNGTDVKLTLPSIPTYNFSGTTFYSGNQSNAEHNADNIKYNGVYYWTSNGPTPSLGMTDKGSGTSDGAIFAQAYGTTWVGQIAQDYRNGNLFVRGMNNGTWQSWLRIPTASAKSVGNSTTPVYMAESGQLTALSYTIAKSVPSDAVFTDTKVKATAKTDNVNYKILATASASPTSGNATEAVYDADITLNPSTNTIAANITGTSSSVGSLLYAFKPGTYQYGYTHLFTVDYGTVKKGMCTFRVSACRGINVVVTINASISRTDGGSTKAWMAVEGETEASTGYFKLSYKAASDSTTDRPKYEVWLIDTGSSASAERRVGVEVVNTNIAAITPGNNSTTTLPEGLSDFTYANIKDAHTHSVKINGAIKTIAASGGTAVDLDYHPTARAASATTVTGLIQEVRVLPGGSVGSVNFASVAGFNGVQIPAGWFNYIWTPHRAGASGGDHQDYGTLILSSMTTTPATFVIEGASLSSSPIYRAKCLTLSASVGKGNFSNIDGQYRLLGTLTGRSDSTDDMSATFLVNVAWAGVHRSSAILDLNLRTTYSNGTASYTYYAKITCIGSSKSTWTTLVKLYRNNNKIYIYGLGRSNSWFSILVTPLSITDLAGVTKVTAWEPECDASASSTAPSYTALSFDTVSYVATSSTSGVLMNDGSVTTKSYGGASTTGKTYYVMGAEGSDAGWKDTKMLAGIRTYNDANNGHILYVGNTSGTGGTVDKGRVYLATGGGYTARIEPSTGISTHRDYRLPKTTETTHLVGASTGGVGSSTQPIYVNSDGVATTCGLPNLVACQVSNATANTKSVLIGTAKVLNNNAYGYLDISFTARHGNGVVSGTLTYKGSFKLVVFNNATTNTTGSHVTFRYKTSTVDGVDKVTLYAYMNAWTWLTIDKITTGGPDSDFSFDSIGTSATIPSDATDIPYSQLINAPLATAVGSSTQPVYVDANGVVSECTTPTATALSDVSTTNANNVNVDSTNGVKVGKSGVALVTQITSSGITSKANGAGTEIGSNGVTVRNAAGTSVTTMTSVGFTGNLTGNVTGDLTGNVTGNVNGSAARLANTSKQGDTDKPVYFTANGVPAVCTSISLNVTGNLTGNADTASALVVPAQVGSDSRPVYFTAQGTPSICGSRFLYGCDSSGSPITTQYRVCIGSVCSANNSISIV